MSDHFGFLLLGPIPANVMSGTYNYTLVFMSYMVAVLASFAALYFAGRMRSEINKQLHWYWLIGGAVTLGTGIWSMHFIGMLAFTMPIPMTYNAMLTALSLWVAILASGLAFFLLHSLKVSRALFMFGGILVGL